MKKICLLLGAAIILGVGCQGLPPRTTPPGLTVQDGVLLKAGRPYCGLGANYFDCFLRTLANGTNTSYEAGFQTLAEHHIPFARFSATGFWPRDMQLYQTNRAEYFRRLDGVVRSAERHGIGLIPSLFWHAALVPDLVGEHLDELGNPRSRSIEFIRRYSAEVVTRYQDSPAIWGWEFGNEYNLGCDLPNAASHRSAVVPGLGTPASRTERDEIKFDQVRIAFAAFAETVRKFDQTRIIISGNSIPRPSAWHNIHEKKWTADTAEQFHEMLLRDNPAPMNILCVHHYPEKQGGYPVGIPTYRGVIKLMQEFSRQAGKPLFIGEFGAARQTGTRAEQQALFAEMLAAITGERVPLSAFWVFELAHQEKDWNVTTANDRAWMLAAVAQANAQIQGENR